LYWELLEATVVWVRLTPGDPSGTPPLLSLVFQAVCPGRAQLDPCSGIPQWPTRTPNRLVVRAEPLIAGRIVEGEALGFPIQLATADQRAPADFAKRVGMAAQVP
jgi:hypothetical protein